MNERDGDIATLQNLITRSIEQAGDFLRMSFQMPQHSLSARQLVRYLKGTVTVAFATVTAHGEPRIAPVGSILYRGEFYIPTVAAAARVKHIERGSAISLSYFEQGDFAVIVHGRGQIVRLADPVFADLEKVQKESTGQTVRDWGEGVYIRVFADRLYTFARHPERFEE
jgi:hypothetical protein